MSKPTLPRIRLSFTVDSLSLSEILLALDGKIEDLELKVQETATATQAPKTRQPYAPRRNIAGIEGRVYNTVAKMIPGTLYKTADLARLMEEVGYSGTGVSGCMDSAIKHGYCERNGAGVFVRTGKVLPMSADPSRASGQVSSQTPSQGSKS